MSRALVALAAVFVAATAFPQETPDRSGEEHLKAVLEACGNLRNTRMLIARYDLGTEWEVSPADGTIELWYAGPGRFRMHYHESMGGGFLGVSDGETLMLDNLGETSAVTLRKAAGSFRESGNNFGAAQQGSHILTLLDGPAAMEAIAPLDASVVHRQRRGFEEIEIKRGSMWMIIRYRTEGGFRLMEVRSTSAGGSQRGGGRFRRDKVLEWEPVNRWEPWVLSTTPPEGVPVNDQRNAQQSGG